MQPTLRRHPASHGAMTSKYLQPMLTEVVTSYWLYTPISYIYLCIIFASIDGEREGDIVGVEATSKWDESPSMFEDSFGTLPSGS